MSYDQTVVQGNLGTDVELRKTGNETPVANFRVAVEYPAGDAKATEWYSVTCWDRAATIAAEYLKKGDQVLLIGNMRTRSWKDDEQQQHYRTELNIQGPSGLRLLSQREGGGERQRGGREGGRQRSTRAPRQRAASPPSGDAPLPQVPAEQTAQQQPAPAAPDAAPASPEQAAPAPPVDPLDEPF